MSNDEAKGRMRHFRVDPEGTHALQAESGEGGYVADYVKAANARRLVACWNLCEGISTEQLECDIQNGGLVNQRLAAEAAERECDQLLAELDKLKGGAA